MSSTQPTPPTDRAELEKDIEVTRERLAATADALAAKADVKGQAQAKVADLKEQVQHRAVDVKERAVTSVHGASASAPGTAKQQGGALVAVAVVATALTVWLVVRKKR